MLQFSLLVFETDTKCNMGVVLEKHIGYRIIMYFRNMCFYIRTHGKACEGFGPTLSGHVENYTVLIWFLIVLQNVEYSIYLCFFFSPK